MKADLKVIISLTALMLCFSSVAFPWSGTCVRVVDGDTIVVECRTDAGVEVDVVRLYGVDCPEPRRGGKQDYSDEAKAFTESMVLNRVVEVDLAGNKFDQHGRPIVVVTANGKSLNHELVKEGLAWWWPARKDTELERLQNEARAARKGLWAHPNPIPPWDHRHGELGPSWHPNKPVMPKYVAPQPAPVPQPRPSKPVAKSPPIEPVTIYMRDREGREVLVDAHTLQPVPVQEYTTKDGTYVSPHTRSAPHAVERDTEDTTREVPSASPPVASHPYPGSTYGSGPGRSSLDKDRSSSSARDAGKSSAGSGSGGPVHVKEHTRTLKDGREVTVKAHNRSAPSSRGAGGSSGSSGFKGGK